MARNPITHLWAGTLTCIAAVATAQPPPQSNRAYPWDMPLEQVAAFRNLRYEAHGVTVSIAKGYCAPIVVQLDDQKGAKQPQVTGMEVLGEGTVSVRAGDKAVFQGDLYGAMFRFHPDDQKSFLSIEEQKPEASPGLRALLLHLCQGSFPRFWHRGMQAFIPESGAVAVWGYVKAKGGVMIYREGGRLVGFCMDTRETLFGQ